MSQKPDRSIKLKAALPHLCSQLPPLGHRASISPLFQKVKELDSSLNSSSQGIVNFGVGFLGSSPFTNTDSFILCMEYKWVVN